MLYIIIVKEKQNFGVSYIR